MNRQISLFVITLCLSLCPTLLVAQTTTIDGDPADVWLRSFGPGSRGSFVNINFFENGSTVRAGHFSNPDGSSPSNVAGVFVFQLPDVGVTANPFTLANFEYNFNGPDANSAAPTYNVDLYGFVRRSAIFISSDLDFYVGPADTASNVTLLQDDALTPTSSPGLQSVSIVDYMNEQYDGGAGAGQFLLLRISPDFNPNIVGGGQDGYLIASANATNVSLRPRIEFSTEPVTAVLVGDVNMDNQVNFSDIAPFISLLSTGESQVEADVNLDGNTDFLDIAPFIGLLSGS